MLTKSFTIICFFFLFLCFLSCPSDISSAPFEKSAQLPHNLNFESKDLSEWIFGGEGYNIKLDNSEAAEGQQSLSISSTNELDSDAFGYAVIKIPAKSYHKKKIRFSGYLKTEDVAQIAALWIRADEQDSPVAIMRMSPENCPRKNSEWKKYSIDMDIPSEATLIFLGISLYGTGATWIDNISIEILPPSESLLIDIGGRILDEEGNPVPDALVTAKTYYQESALAMATSDHIGEFTFHLLPGVYMINATAKDKTGASILDRNYSKNLNDLTITLNQGEGLTIRGNVKLPQNTIPQDMYVAALKMNFFGCEIFYSRPDAQGNFEIKVPKGTPYMIMLDSPEFEAIPITVDSDFKGTCTLYANKPQPASKEVVSWIKQNAIALKTAEPGHGFSDLQPLKEIIGSTRMVGLGETSHGNREIFQMKHRLIEFLVEEMDFTVVAFEESWAAALAINAYVIEGIGDPEKLFENHFVWDTEEVLALLKWIRSYNSDPSHPKKVKFYGLDVFDQTVATDRVFKYLQEIDPDYAKESAEKLSILQNPTMLNEIYKYSDEQCQSLKDEMKSFLKSFDKNQKLYSSKSTPRQWLETRQLVRFLQQSVNFGILGRVSDYEAIDFRDQSIAENAQWILDNEPPGTKIAYWAHNYHINFGQYPGFLSYPMGKYMKQRIGDDYLAIGFEFNRGSLQTRDGTSSRTPFMIRSFTFDPIPGSYAATMSRTGIPLFLLDLHLIPKSGKIHDWFNSPHVFKSIDSLFANIKDVQHLMKVPEYFDAVIFLEKTTRTRPNPSQLLPGQRK